MPSSLEVARLIRVVRFLNRLAIYLLIAVVGVLAGAFALAAYQGRNGPPLEIWHTANLTAEFAADKADEIRNFDDYRRLEDSLFAELEERVFAQVAVGPEKALARFSAGSAADPRQREPNWNRSFEMPIDAPIGGVLLLHGLTDSPYTLRALGEALNERGHWVLGLRLPGHGTAPSGLATVTWEDMAAAVRLGMEHLATSVGPMPLHVVGYSTGAPLVIDYVLTILDGAAGPRPASLVLISPAIGVTPAAALAKWKARLATLPGFGRFAWTQILPEFDPYKYNSFTANAGDQVHRLTRSVARRVEARAASGAIDAFPPTLVFLSAVDATVSTEAVIDNLLEHLAGARHELVLFDINRRNVASTVLVADPGPLTARLMANEALPFALTVVTNANAATAEVVKQLKPAFSSQSSVEPLDLAWPPAVISLSHVALPFPPDDPLYGQQPPKNDDAIFLGQIAIQGERGLLKLPGDWLLRLRHNPLYPVLETRVLEWMDGTPKQ